MCFEDSEVVRRLLSRLLHNLPTRLGSARYLEEHPSDSFVVLFTHDHNNAGGRANEAQILLTLAEAQAITFFGVEGARGPFNFVPYRTFPDRFVSREVTNHLFSTFKLQPIEHTAIVCTDPIFVWGVEDEGLYLKAVELYRSGGAGYWSVIEQRAPVLLENLVAKMAEVGTRIAGLCVTGYNFDRGHEWLSERRIAHVGIWASDSGDTQWGRLDSALRNEPYDEQEALEWEVFSNWRRPRGKRYRAATPAKREPRKRGSRRTLRVSVGDSIVEIRRTGFRDRLSSWWTKLKRLMRRGT
jgi:hypothetical protein